MRPDGDGGGDGDGDGVDDREAVIQETLDALEMPASGLRRWFDHVSSFCDQHGGERHYAELLRLMRDYAGALERRQK